MLISRGFFVKMSPLILILQLGCMQHSSSQLQDVGVVDTHNGKGQVLYEENQNVYLKVCDPAQVPPVTRTCVSQAVPRHLSLGNYLNALPFPVDGYPRSAQGLALVTKLLEDASVAARSGVGQAEAAVSRLTVVKANLEKILQIKDSLDIGQRDLTYYEYHEEYAQLLQPFKGSEGCDSNKLASKMLLPPGCPAPYFANIPAYDPQGNETTLSLDSMTEDVIVLAFLANHCPAVQALDSRIIDLVHDYQGKSFRFVAVNVNDVSEDKLPGIREKILRGHLPYAYGDDESQAIGKAYNVRNNASFFVIDRDRIIRYSGAFDDHVMNGDKVTKEYLRSALDAVFAGQRPEVETTQAVGTVVQYLGK